MNQLRNLKSAAAVLGISPWTVRSFISKGQLTPVRIGRRVLLEESELERFISAGRATKLGNSIDPKEDIQ
jgi:excisionase family DNA binding protein